MASVDQLASDPASVALPGIGLVIAGPLAAAAAGAGAGAAGGGLLGALIGWNMPEERVKVRPLTVPSEPNCTRNSAVGLDDPLRAGAE